MIKPKRLEIGDKIGIVAPPRPIKHIEKEINDGIKVLEGRGFKVKLGENLYKKSYYSAGSAKERASDLNVSFARVFFVSGPRQKWREKVGKT